MLVIEDAPYVLADKEQYYLDWDNGSDSVNVVVWTAKLSSTTSS